MFILDNVLFKNLCISSVSKNVTLVDNNTTSERLDGSYVRNIAGLKYEYSMNINGIASFPDEYNTLISMLSQKVEYHNCVLPYNANEMKSFDMYVESFSDNLVYAEIDEETGMPNYEKDATPFYWDGLSINFKSVKLDELEGAV